MPATQRPKGHIADIAPTAALMADRTRAVMLAALLDEGALAAGELAQLAGVTPATASAHLSRLLDGDMVTVISQGRHRYYQLAGADVAAAIEALSQLRPEPPVRSLKQSRQAAALAEARTCYDHLAGRAGVALLDALLAGGLLTARPPDAPLPAFDVTQAGAGTLTRFGVDPEPLRRSRRRFAGACLDWTQRSPHLNGALGAAITSRLLHLRWIERGRQHRSVRITPAGREGLADTFGLRPEVSRSES
jgi:DNA-binding transcriptional ArsR family regulator